MSQKFFLSFLILALLSLGSVSAAPIEEATLNQPGDADLVRGSLIIRDTVKVFGDQGLGLIPPNGSVTNSINLSTNQNGDLVWNNNGFINSNGQLNNPQAGSIKLNNNPNFICNNASKGTLVYSEEFNSVGLCDGIEIVDQEGFPLNKFHRVFVTTQKTSANFGGVAAADRICQQSAENAKLSGEWIALLNSAYVNAKDRVPNNFNLIRLDGVIVNKNGLWDGDIDNPILITETGADLTAIDQNIFVWSGSSMDINRLSDGKVGFNSAGIQYTCEDWTSTSNARSASRGVVLKSYAPFNIGRWFDGHGISCSFSASNNPISQAHFYCVEIRK